MSQLPCDIFMYQAPYRWRNGSAGQFPDRVEHERRSLARLIWLCEVERGIRPVDDGPSYEELVFHGPGQYYLSRLVMRFPLPGDFVEYFMTNIPDDERSAGKDLEFLRHVHHWYMIDIEE